ncbi:MULTISPECIES: AbiJ-NTD4 domain-containing protein [unclassified Microbacterium]|uniref:AbiJ-NTD4 domain-containing protein n=1 Tax=unclassified Microbacterium TaxID=2609290 RepID=UPI00214B59ED|nr:MULTISPECIES: hypothetical protein [unclassified Microbacterium]MCR2784024.1 hypothetical protein [Microbacterium sp. zg.B96]WIM15135.1 hypothetical protein QNO11_11340 [Microbacterium sp. zg-B96]
MASFAERMGHRATRSVIQTDSLDEDTRTELWNVLHILQNALDRAERAGSKTQEELVSALWRWQFKNPADEEPPDYQVWRIVKASIIQGEWFDVLDLIEEIVRYTQRSEDFHTSKAASAVAEAMNGQFENYLVGFRFIGGKISPLDSTAEADAVVTAQTDAHAIAGARHALDRAVEHLADRQNPDYANSMKESISAVEAVVKKITGEHTLGAGLSKLEAAGLTIHPALKGAWSKMYGWTSDGSGIRHGDIDAADADQALAKYMLVTCSAFVSYLIEQGRKKGLLK